MGRREDRKEASRKRWGQIAIGIFLVLLMVLSIVQFADYGGQQGLEYEGYDFALDAQGGYSVEAGGRTIPLHSFPLERNGTATYFQAFNYDFVTVEAAPGLGDALRGANLRVITFDPTLAPELLQVSDLSRSYLSAVLPQTVPAVLENSTMYSGFPVVDCSQAGEGLLVIELLIDNETASEATITLDGSCVVAKGGPVGLLVAKDYLILAYEGVIDG